MNACFKVGKPTRMRMTEVTFSAMEDASTDRADGLPHWSLRLPRAGQTYCFTTRPVRAEPSVLCASTV